MIEIALKTGRRGRAPRRLFLAGVAVAMLVAATGAALAQTAALSPMSGLYRLEKGSQYEQGCFAPCLCPVLIAEAVRGTFVLSPRGFDGLFTHYAVTDVNWLINLGGNDTFVTGSGTYRIGGEFALQQELALDLKVGDDKVEHFTSGLVTGPAPFPSIGVTISVNNQTCFDTVFRVNASPVPPDEVSPYRLLAGSTLQRGCFGTCDCLIGPLLPLGGSFALVPLAPAPPWNEFAVIGVRWRARSSPLTAAAPDMTLRGAGFYVFGGDGPPRQRLELLLKMDSGSPARFDSGLVPGGDHFPRIDARISVSGALCFDTVIDLHAVPRRPASRPSALADGGAAP